MGRLDGLEQIRLGGDRRGLHAGPDRRQLQVLLVFLRAVIAAREDENQRIIALEFAQVRMALV